MGASYVAVEEGVEDVVRHLVAVVRHLVGVVVGGRTTEVASAEEEGVDPESR